MVSRVAEVAPVGGDKLSGGRHQAISQPVLGIVEPHRQLVEQHPAHRAREEQAVGQRGAQDAEDDLGNPRAGDVEDGLGPVDGGEGDDRGGVAGQHQHIAARAAIQQRDGKAPAHPQRQRGTEQQWLVHQRRHQRHRRHRADYRAHHTIRRL